MKVLRYIKSISKDQVKLDFFGTEPLMSLSLLELTVEWIKLNKANWDLGLVTNGVLITPKVAKFLKAYNFDVLISYDGKTHDEFRKFRNGKGSRNRVRKGVTNLLNVGIEPTCAMSVMPQNCESLLENVQDAYDLGFKHIWLNKIIENAPEYDPFEIRQAYKQVAEWYLTTPVVIDYLHTTLTKMANNVTMTQDNTCGACKNSIGIDMNGNIAPCHRLAYMGEFVGSIKRTELELNKWRSKKFLQCNDCVVLYCFPCYAENKALTGSYDKIPAAWCIFEAARHEAAISIFERWREGRGIRRSNDINTKQEDQITD